MSSFFSEFLKFNPDFIYEMRKFRMKFTLFLANFL